MKDLNQIIETESVASMEESIKKFVLSALDNPDRLKLTIGSLFILRDVLHLLETISPEDFIIDIKKEIDSIENMSKEAAHIHHLQFLQNNEIMRVLKGDTSQKIKDLQDRIQNALSSYDQEIRMIIQLREQLPLESQLKIESHS